MKQDKRKAWKRWGLTAALCAAVVCAAGSEAEARPLGLTAALCHGVVLPGREAGGLLVPNRGTLASSVDQAGYFKGIRLAGRVRVVEHFPDIRVRVVTSFPDLRVKAVEHFPDAIGEWQFVDNFADFTIMYVSSFEDLRIQFVTSFPGLP